MTSLRDTLGRPGVQVPAAMRAPSEVRLGRDFSHVRLHTDPTSAAVTRAFGARAMTYGHHILARPSRVDLGSERGQAVLAHELFHVAQQGQAQPAEPRSIARPDGPVERAARDFAHGGACVPTPARAAPGTLMLDQDEEAAPTVPVYPTAEQRADVMGVLAPQKAKAEAKHEEVPAVTDPEGFRHQMVARMQSLIDDRVLPPAEAMKSSPVVVKEANLSAIGGVAQTEVGKKFGAYIAGLPAGFQLAQHLHLVPENPPEADLALAVESWVDSRMRAIGADLIQSHHVLAAGLGAPDARDQALWNDTRKELLATRKSSIETIIRYHPGYEKGHEAYIQPRARAETSENAETTARKARWRAFGTAVHEMMHQLAHPKFNAAVEGLEESGIATEGFAEFFAGQVYDDLVQTGDRKVRDAIEGAPPPPYISPPERVPGLYKRYTEGVVAIKRALGGNEENLRVAFFSGKVEYIGLGGWTAEAAKTIAAKAQPANVLSAAALLDLNDSNALLLARYGRVIYGRGGDLQLNLGAGINYLTTGSRLGVTGDLSLRYSGQHLFVEGNLGVGGSGALGQPGGAGLRLDLMPGFEAGIRIGVFHLGGKLLLLVPLGGGTVSDPTIRVLTGIGASLQF
jgi:hypothetical protein